MPLRVDAISFTGSVGTGRRILAGAAERGAKVHLEMGSKNPNFPRVQITQPVANLCAFFTVNAKRDGLTPAKLTCGRRVSASRPGAPAWV